MTAKTKFYTCGNCGFVNAPHAFRQGSTNNYCEQCGVPNSHPDTFDGKVGA